MLLGQQGEGSGKQRLGDRMTGQLANVASRMHLGSQLGKLRAGAASIMRPGGSKAAATAPSTQRSSSEDGESSMVLSEARFAWKLALLLQSSCKYSL